MHILFTTAQEIVPLDEPEGELGILSEQLAELSQELDELDEEFCGLNAELEELDEGFEQCDLLIDAINETLVAIHEFVNLELKSALEEKKGGVL